MQAGHHARQKHDPRRVDAPAIEPLQAPDDRFAQLLRGVGVAENAVLDPLLKSFKHARWSAKVAVGDPQRNDVAPGIALPAGAPGAGALERRVEIEPHLAVIAKKTGHAARLQVVRAAYFGVFSSSSSFCGCPPFSGSSSRRFMLSSTSWVSTERCSERSCSGSFVAMPGTNMTMAMAMHCSAMNSNMPLWMVGKDHSLTTCFR